MPGNDFRIVVGHGQKFRRARDHAADAAARSVVDVRKHAIEEDVARLQNIALLEMNIDIGIRVRRRDMHERNAFAVHRYLVALRESLLRQGFRRRRRKSQVQHGERVRFGHPFLRVHMRDQGCACGAQRCVVVGVIEMPVRVNRRLDRRFPDRAQRVLEVRPRGLHERVSHQFSVRAIQHHHISARARQQREAARERLRLYRHAAKLRAHGRDLIARRLLLRKARELPHGQEPQGKIGPPALRQPSRPRPATFRAA